MVEALGISLKEFIFYLINFAILVAVLKIFLYKPFMENLDRRKAAIKESLDSAEKANRAAEARLADSEKRIAGTKQECEELIRTAKLEAADEAKEILAQANAKADDIVAEARKDIAMEKDKAMNKMKEEIADLAMLAATKIVEHDMEDKDRQNEIIDQIIADNRESTWQS